jgi:uncharacterized membrane protein (GlpM family)
VLALKLALVPAFLLLVSVAGRLWGPAIAGRLAGLPLVTGPILFFLALERGPEFTARAATAALSAVVASQCCSVAYAHAAQRLPWPLALCTSLTTWFVAALLLSVMPPSLPLALLVALTSLTLAPRLFPKVVLPPVTVRSSRAELMCRMIAGAALTLAVTWAGSIVGERWTGLLSVFPLLGSVLAVFSHRTFGAAYAAVILRGLALGMYSFAAFCVALALVLPLLGVTLGFSSSVVVALLAQVLTRRAIGSVRQ